MIPKTFQDKLERLDRALFVRIERARGRYVIYRKDRNNMPREILVVEDHNGNYATPSYEHIAMLYKMDMWTNKNFIRDMDRANQKIKDDNNRKLELLSYDVVEQATRSNFY